MSPGIAAERNVVESAVPTILDGRLQLQTANGNAELPVHVTQDWTQPQPSITRAVIFIHGWPRRDLGADDYVGKKAGDIVTHTIFITPQFLTGPDIAAHQLPDTMLRWSRDGWRDGYDALAPAAFSSFAVIDAVFEKLADKKLFPNLQNVVLAGHSAGGQFVQRYAAIGHGEQPLAAAGIHVRYVVANPSSYLYFDDMRMQADGNASRVDSTACTSAGNWNYGFARKTPPYLQQPFSVAALQEQYLAKDVVYLLGTADDDPHGDAVDQSCGAETQGANRYARGLTYAAYVRYLSQGKSAHRLMEVKGVAHRSYLMYASACGIAALFDAGSNADFDDASCNPANSPQTATANPR
ncbi:alpha/beta hydrolase [Undibacterium terreum]|nr:alpha/beta hydrolase [Undibacterium terreum]